MTALDRCLNVYDLRAAAKRRLPKAVFEFVDRGSEDGIAVANNRNAFERIKLRQIIPAASNAVMATRDRVSMPQLPVSGARTLESHGEAFLMFA